LSRSIDEYSDNFEEKEEDLGYDWRYESSKFSDKKYWSKDKV
jgi:hypothetical protein